MCEGLFAREMKSGKLVRGVTVVEFRVYFKGSNRCVRGSGSNFNGSDG